MPYITRWSRMVATVALALLVALVATPSLAMAVVGPIQGTITNSAASPLSGVHVVVQGVSTTAAHWDDFTTGPDGMYTFAVPESGDYSVTAEDPASVYLTDTHLVSNVTTDTTVTSDFTLARPGGISGTVTDAMSSALVQQIEVQSLRLAGDFEYWDGTDLTDQYGRYAIGGANPGPHAVYFYDGSARAVPYAPQWYNGALTAATATTVTVTEGATTPDIDAALFSDTVLGGRVTDANTGVPLGTTIITIQNDNTADLAWLVTSADGTYRIAGLPAGTYTVAALSPEDDYTNFSQGVTLLDNQVLTSVDFAMAPTAAGILAGRAVDSGTSPLAGIEVRLANGLPTDNNPVVFSTLTGAGGTFFLPPRTGNITLTFVDPTGAHPTLVTTLVAAGPANLGDFVLGDAGTISGITVDSGGTPLAGVFIRLYNASDPVAPIDSAVSGLDGRYSFGDLAAGSYRLAFDADDYQSEFFNNATAFAGATDVTLIAGGSALANAVLSPPGTIAGNVTDITDQPSVGTLVTLWHVGPNGLEAAGLATTDGTGAFSIGSLVSGDYLINLSGGLGSGYVIPGGQWLTSSTSLAAHYTIPDSLTPVTLNVAVRYAFDAIAPTAVIDLASANTFGTWHSSPTTVTVSVIETGSGVATINYTLDGGPTQIYSGPFPVSGDGTHTVTAWVTDNVGNVGPTADQTFGIDEVAPVVDPIAFAADQNIGDWYSSPTMVTITAHDAESGVAQILYILDGAPAAVYGEPFAVAASGSHTFEYWAIDNVGNEAAHQDATIFVGNIAAGVAGTVTDGTSPLAGMHVVIQGANLAVPFWDETTTASDGTYAFGVPQPGDYTVRVDDPSGAFSSQQKAVTVVTGATSVLDFTLGAPGSVSGSVVDSSTSDPVQLIDVQSLKLVGDFEYWDGWTLTDPYGKYTLDSLDPVDHLVYFSDSSQRALPYAAQWFDGVTDQALATAVAVNPASTTTGINARLVADTSISGTVTDSVNGMPIGNTIIQIQNDNTADIAWTSTAPDGTYRVTGLALGTYTVWAQSQTGDYIDQSALDIVLDASQTSAVVDFALSPMVAGYMTGRVVDGSASPLAGIEVRLAMGVPSDGNPWLFSTLTAADGTFSLPPRTGDITLTFVDPTGAHPTLVTTLTAAGPADLGDFVMGADAVISGMVTDVNDTPLAGAFVRLWNATDPVAPIDSAVVGLDGRYSFGSLDAGDYKVSFDSPPVYMPEFYDNALTFGHASVITLAADGNATANAVLSKPATIQGTITTLGGGPAAGATVRAFRLVPASTPETAGVAVTDASGHYSIDSLLSGDYVIQLEGNGIIGYVMTGHMWLTSNLADAEVFNIPDALDPFTLTVDARLALDETPPVVNATVDAAHSFTGDWYSSPATVTITATDAISGVDHVSYQINGGPVIDTATGVDTVSFTLVDEGHYVITYSAVDILGNVSATKTLIVNIDTTPPDVSATINAVPVGGFYPPTTVTLAATDIGGSGVATIFYTLDGGPTTTYSSPIPVNSTGEHTVVYWAVDNVANESAHTPLTFTIDADGPSMPGDLGLTHVRFDRVDLVWSPSTDAGSGLDFYEVAIDGVVVATTTETSYEVRGLFPDTTYEFTVTAVDVLGNRSTPADIDVTTPASTFAQHVNEGTDQTVTFVNIPFNCGLKSFVFNFDSVTASGTLYLKPLGSETDLDVSDTLRTIGGYFDFDFAGTFTGGVHVTMPYDKRLPDFRAQNMVLVHWVNGVPETIDTTVDTNAHTVMFTLTSLSPVVLAEPVTYSMATSLSAAWAGTSATRISPAYGTTVKITGRLTDADGSDLYAGAVVDVQRLDGGVWVTIGQANRSAGLYSFPVHATSLTYYRLSFSGDSFNDASISPEISLYPKVKLSLNDLRSSYSHRTSFTVRGSILPAHTAGSTRVVSVRLYRWRGNHWVLYNVVRARIGSNGTSYSASVRLPTPGRWKLVPIAYADSQHAETLGSAKYTRSR